MKGEPEHEILYCSNNGILGLIVGCESVTAKWWHSNTTVFWKTEKWTSLPQPQSDAAAGVIGSEIQAYCTPRSTVLRNP